MTNLERAKQFMPFDAMKGLKEALRKKEEKYCRVEKKELSDDEKEELCASLIKINKGDRVQITFYYLGHYLTLDGTVLNKNIPYKYLTIGTQKIFFDDIYYVCTIEEDLQ